MTFGAFVLFYEVPHKFLSLILEFEPEYPGKIQILIG